MREFLEGVFIFWFFIGGFFGIALGVAHSELVTGCQYKTIASFHPVYFLTCEALRKRF